MEQKKLIPFIEFKGGDKEQEEAAVIKAGEYSNTGADLLMVFIEAYTDQEWDEGLESLRKICQQAEMPVIASGRVKRMEDVKKILYAGCQKAIVSMAGESREALLEEVSKKFGKDQIIVLVEKDEMEKVKDISEKYASAVVFHGWVWEGSTTLERICMVEKKEKEELVRLLKEDQADGISGGYINQDDVDLFALKKELKKENIPVAVFETAIEWKDFKLNSDGMVPVVVQDYKTCEVLMLAYMNEEAFYNTLETGKMTYWSRSRNELWVKGMTSGHFQYVKSLTLDCDNDTILAKVSQIGAACHTGNRSCFFKELAKKPYDDTNPLNVFQDVYSVIKDRKIHPREGSYTNYLYEKGIDKILKKVGEECTEIVIAAKNPDPIELTYEMADFLYHMMVLMAEKNMEWDDITRELARR